MNQHKNSHARSSTPSLRAFHKKWRHNERRGWQARPCSLQGDGGSALLGGRRRRQPVLRGAGRGNVRVLVALAVIDSVSSHDAHCDVVNLLQQAPGISKHTPTVYSALIAMFGSRGVVKQQTTEDKQTKKK